MYTFDFEKSNLLHNMVNTIYSISQVAVWGCSIYIDIEIIMGDLEKLLFLFTVLIFCLSLEQYLLCLQKAKKPTGKKNRSHRKS